MLLTIKQKKNITRINNKSRWNLQVAIVGFSAEKILKYQLQYVQVIGLYVHLACVVFWLPFIFSVKTWVLSWNVFNANILWFCLQSHLGWCNFLASYCKIDKSQSSVNVGVELQLLSDELDKTDGLLANNSDNKFRSEPVNTRCDQNLSSLRQASTS